MVQRLDPSSEAFLAALQRVSQRAERATRQIATGYRVTAPSDDPDQISNLLQARVELDQTTQIRLNLGRVQTEVDTAEQTVSSAVKLMERARVLGVQGANTTQTADARTTLADELDGILRQMVNMSATQVQGRYIFSGDADSVAPYTWNEALPNPIVGYNGSPATRLVMHPSGTTFAVAHTAGEIFDAPGESSFQALQALSAGLRAGDQIAINAGISAVRIAGDHLNRQLAFYGLGQGQVKQALDSASKMELRLNTEISAVQETDVTAAILELQQATTQQQAALQARAKLPRTSLFDFLG
jgi:flagellar hook-associated protein 3 FlgL